MTTKYLNIFNRIEISINKFLFYAILLISCSCSIKKNTAWTRFYHNMTSRYNVLYNGESAFDESYNNSIENLKESYFVQIPLDPVSYYITETDGGNGNYTESIKKGRKAVEEHSLRTKPDKSKNWKKDPKERQWQQQSEYNSYIYNAWILIGKSQFYSGDILGALSTFSFMDRLYKTQSGTRIKANIWQARCYNQLGWYDDARKMLDDIKEDKDKVSNEYKRLYDIAMVNNLIGIGKDDEAVEILEQLAPNMGNDILAARAFFLLGQLYEKKGNTTKASKAYAKVLNYTTKTDIELSARLKSIDLDNRGIDDKIRTIKKLSDKNRYKTSLDAIMYSLGNQYLSKKDTAKAIETFKMGADTSQIKKMDYALNLISLGNLLFEKENYVRSAEAFNNAISAIDSKYDKYDSIRRKNEALSRLKVFAEPLMIQDSLRRIASLPEKDLRKHIDSLIEIAKKTKNDDDDRKWMEEQKSKHPVISDNTSHLNIEKGNGKFYFYNPVLVENGKVSFRKKWGNISLQDNWQRNGMSIKQDLELKKDSTNNKNDIQNNEQKSFMDADDPSNPLSYAYYLSPLPMTPESKIISDSIVSESLMGMSNILLIDFDRKDRAEKAYKRIINELPKSKDREEAINRLILLLSLEGRTKEAENYKQLYIKDYPAGTVIKSISSDNFIKNLQKVNEIAEIKYNHALDMLKNGSLDEVEKTYQEMIHNYHDNPNMAKLTLLSALAKGQKGDNETLIKRMQTIRDEYGSSDVLQMATHIMDEVKKGRQIVNTNYKFETDKQIVHNTDTETDFDYNKNELFSLLVIYPHEANVSEGEIFFEITAFNYEHFTQEDINISQIPSDISNMILIKGAKSPFNYIAMASSSRGFLNNISQKAIIIPISEKDVSKLKTTQNLDIYLSQLKKYVSKEVFENIMMRVIKSEILSDQQ